MINDDELVLLFLEIEQIIINLNDDQRLSFITTIENIFENEHDSDLGCFINNIASIYFNFLGDTDSHTMIRSEIYDSDLNYPMLFEVGATMIKCLYGM